MCIYFIVQFCQIVHKFLGGEGVGGLDSIKDFMQTLIYSYVFPTSAFSMSSNISI